MYDELILFIKIVKLGGFYEASKAVGISRSSLTRKIQNLEKCLNFILLKRDTRTLELSNAGKILYDKFCNLEAEINRVITDIGNSNNEISGLINVLLPPFFAMKIITPYLIDFMNEYPKITLNICYQNRQTNLIKDNFDLAIINHRPLKNSQKVRLLCRGKIIFYCYKEYIEKLGLCTTASQLENVLILRIMLDHEIASKSEYLINKSSGLKKAFKPAYRLTQDSGVHDQEFVRSGLTIGAGMDIMMKNDIDSGVVVQILPDYYLPGFDYFLLTNPESKNARTEVFIGFINKCMQRLNLNENLMMR